MLDMARANVLEAMSSANIGEKPSSFVMNATNEAQNEFWQNAGASLCCLARGGAAESNAAEDPDGEEEGKEAREGSGKMVTAGVWEGDGDGEHDGAGEGKGRFDPPGDAEGDG